MVSEYDPAHPDENVEYYQAKLDELYAKFKPYIDRPGLFAPSEVDTKAGGQREMFDEPAPDAGE